jgi:glucokinase
VQNKYTAAPTQNWSVTNLGHDVVVLKLAGTELCLEVPRAANGAGASLGMATYLGKSHQKWKLVSVGEGFHEIINANSVLEANVNFNAMVPGIAISQWSVGNYANGVWAFTPVTAKQP